MTNYEDILVGCILVGEVEIVHRMEQEDFTSPFCRKVYGVAKDIHSSGGAVDLVTIHHAIGGEFTTLAAYTKNLNPSLRFSAMNAVKKDRAYREAKSFTPSEYKAEELPYRLLEVAQKIRGMLQYDAESLTDILEELRKPIPRTPTGFKRLDSLLDGGIEKGGIFTIGGIPGDGKTAIATHMAAQNLEQGKKVHFITLEMSRPALVRRIMKAYWQKNDLEIQNNLDDAIEMAGELTVTNTLCRLPDVIGSMSKHIDADIIFVDYAQRIQDVNHKDNRVAEIESIYGTMANFAREFNVTLVVLSQLNRDYKSDRAEPPQMYHMKGSGAIEADSHTVGLLHNPNAKEESGKFDFQLVETEKKVETERDDERILYIRKNRNGRIGAIQFVFDKPLSRFNEEKFYDG